MKTYNTDDMAHHLGNAVEEFDYIVTQLRHSEATIEQKSDKIEKYESLLSMVIDNLGEFLKESDSIEDYECWVDDLATDVRKMMSAIKEGAG